MMPTAVLSMWISNTATAAMMLPMAEAVLQQLRDIAGKTNPLKDEKYDVVDGKSCFYK